MAATDILQAVASIIGGLGGCAGFYALYLQHRQQQALPGSIEEHILTLREGATRLAREGARPVDKLTGHERLRTASAELERLLPLLQLRTKSSRGGIIMDDRYRLYAAVDEVRRLWSSIEDVGSGYLSGDPGSERHQQVVAQQIGYAHKLTDAADKAVTMLRKHR